MKLFYKLLFLMTLLLGACSKDKFYNTAHRMYKNSKYVAAIDNYDRYIYKVTLDGTIKFAEQRSDNNGALSTLSELERSDCYYQLGKTAYEKGNWTLAIRLLYLSNSLKADQYADNCYYEMAKIAKTNHDLAGVLANYAYIVRYLTTSELIPEVLYDRILIYTNDYQQADSAWIDYKSLCSRYPDDNYREKAEKVVDTFLEEFIDAAVESKSSSYETALVRLGELNAYPSAFNGRINREIAALYQEMAEKEVANTNYLKAEQYFRQVILFNEEKKAFVEGRLRDICSLFIGKGNELLAQRKIDEAEVYYRKTFGIIPNYSLGQEGINKAETLRARIMQAAQYESEAGNYEKQKEWANASKYYKQAQQLDPSERLEAKLFLMGNMIEIEKDPIEFTKRIITDWRNGIVIQRLEALKKQLATRYKKEDIKIRDWRVMLSIGQDKYEIRYDIVAQDDTYYFVWQIDLRSRKVTPLNTLTEEFFK